MLRLVRAELVPIPPPGPPTLSLNQRIRAHAEANPGPFPPRETELRPLIVIPTYNHARYLPDAVASAVSTGLPVIVIDDASTDNTPAVIEKLSAKWTFRHQRNATNLQQWGTLNRAVEVSDANLFIVLNADDVLLPWAAETILGLWRAYPDIRLLGGNHVPFRRDAAVSSAAAYPKRLLQLPEPDIFTPERTRAITHYSDLNMTMSSSSFARSAWEAAGGFLPPPQRLYEIDDRDFQLRVAALFPVAVIDEPLVMYRLGSSVWLQTA